MKHVISIISAHNSYEFYDEALRHHQPPSAANDPSSTNIVNINMSSCRRGNLYIAMTEKVHETCKQDGHNNHDEDKDKNNGNDEDHDRDDNKNSKSYKNNNSKKHDKNNDNNNDSNHRLRACNFAKTKCNSFLFFSRTECLKTLNIKG